jgi:hypothetical protein
VSLPDAAHRRGSTTGALPMRAVSDDLGGFEEKNGMKLASVVPERFAQLACGRLYDMALGPR